MNGVLGQCQNFLEFLERGHGACSQLEQKSVDEALREGRAWLLFDGLDEIFDPTTRTHVVLEIERFSRQYPLTRIIVTSRIIGYQHQTLRDAGFKHYTLQDLEPEQIDGFIDRWHNLAYLDEYDRQRARERLKKSVAESNSIRELAQNPLLLTLMALLNRHQDLPRDRTELYEQASRLLLHQWDASHALREDPLLAGKSFDYRDKQAMLCAVAHRMQTGAKGLAGNVISSEELEEVLANYLKSLDYEEPRPVAKRLIEQLRARNFILCYLGDEYYGFVHRTFLEFFCAWAFVREFNKNNSPGRIQELQAQTFDAHWQDETWHEVLRLIIGRIDRDIDTKIAEQLIESLLHKVDPLKASHLFLAAKCFSDVRNTSALTTLNLCLYPEVQSLIYFDLPYRYSKWEPEYMQITELRINAVAITTTIWPNTQTRNWLLELTRKEDCYWAVQQAAVRELARGWKDDPRTLLWLQECVQKDRYRNVRQAAVQALAQGWRDDPKTQSLLQQIALDDEHWAVRQAAVRELALGWRSDLKTLFLLQECVRKDKDWAVRQTAVEELARGWKHDPKTIPLLKERLQLDEKMEVRIEAMLELVRGWRDDP